MVKHTVPETDLAYMYSKTWLQQADLAYVYSKTWLKETKMNNKTYKKEC